jgi:hypothetical protein
VRGLWGSKPKHAQPGGNQAASHPSAIRAAKPLSPSLLPAMTWEDRLSVLQVLEPEKGTVRTVKMTLIGRPGKVLDQGSCIVTMMQARQGPVLPKGLPLPAAVSTKYVVYIAAKQWKQVAQALTDPEDVLVVEGFPPLDPQTTSIAVFATNTTTKKLQAARQHPPAKSEMG